LSIYEYIPLIFDFFLYVIDTYVKSIYS
jgi:hypothetical protein